MATEKTMGTLGSTCPRCEGTGVYNFGKCSICDGTGRLNDAGEPYGRPLPSAGPEQPACPACGTSTDRKPGERWVLLDGGKRVCTNPWHYPNGFDRRGVSPAGQAGAQDCGTCQKCGGKLRPSQLVECEDCLTEYDPTWNKCDSAAPSGEADTPTISIEVYQHDWIPGFAAFHEPEGGLDDGAKAHVVLNLGSLMAAVQTGDLDKKDLPYIIAESLMHETIHALESWAKVEFSEDRVEELLTKYREKYERATVWEYTGAEPQPGPYEHKRTSGQPGTTKCDDCGKTWHDAATPGRMTAEDFRKQFRHWQNETGGWFPYVYDLMNAYAAHREASGGERQCHVCKKPTQFACSDCRIDFGVSIPVCGNRLCQDEHAYKCPHELRAELEKVKSELSETAQWYQRMTRTERLIAEMREGLRIAAIRLNICLGRMRACEADAHEVSLAEVPEWVREAEALSKLGGAEKAGGETK